MAAHKPKRGAPTVDMTAMVDVAFLLLTFFILTTTSFRQESKVEVDTPSSISDIEVPATGLMTISIDPDGKVFVGYSDIATREAVLNRAIGEKEWTVTEVGQGYFSNLETFGVPHDKMSEWLSFDPEHIEEFPHPGISAAEDEVAKTTNDLKDWIRWGRLADQKMRFAIKGDIDAKYPAVYDVISSLQDWDVNAFSLITSLEDGAEGEEGEGEGGE
ncbi:MAG: biopolymer transporter ExbD [Bacteroidota bacterium]